MAAPLAGRAAVVTAARAGWAGHRLRAGRGRASVVVSGRDAGRLEPAVTEIETLGVGAGVAADQSKREDCDRLADAAKERFGRIDAGQQRGHHATSSWCG
jgi:3-oxoacyl-[acyl-carrier protein] reductase